MNKLTFIFSVMLFLVGLACPTFSFAQTENNPTEKSYEVVLQTVIASNNQTDKANLPSSLSNVVRKLKAIYPFSNYRLNATYLQRAANGGNVEFKSVSNETAQNPQTYAPVFVEWAIAQLVNPPNAQSGNWIQIKGFRFGQRIPVVVSGSGNSSVINYEQIGLTMQKLNVTENVPTVLGTLSTSKPDELMFLVLTVQPVE